MRSTDIRFCFFLSLVILASCADRKQSDACCTFVDLPAPAVQDDMGKLQVGGSTAAYYEVLDETGKRLARQRLNETVDLPPGHYEVKVNNASHFIEVEPGRMAKCATGTLLVDGHTEERYTVVDSANHPLAHELLGKPVSVFPGRYRVKVNNTATSVTVKLRELTTARTGSLVVHGSTAELFYVLDDTNEQLALATLETALAFLPGTYTIKVNNTSMKGAVVAGGRTELETGNIRVSGLTDEYYYVTDSVGSALNYQRLNKPLAFFPGHFFVTVNNTVMEGEVTGRETTEFVTGGLVLNGNGTTYYYVLDEKGKQFTFNTLNKSLSLFPSRYMIKLGASVRTAVVTPGELTRISAVE